MDFSKIKLTSPVDEINIRQANMFAKRESTEVSCGFDFCDSIGHKNFVDEIVGFHVEVLSALETEGFQRVKHSSAEMLELYLELHRQCTRSIHQTTDDNIRLMVGYKLVWRYSGVIDEPESANHGQLSMFPMLELNLASVHINGPEGFNRIQTDSIIDIPLVGNLYINTLDDSSDIKKD